ncbi:MAG: hypothetical protein IKW39_03275, partial [Alphaproteobacteria bacterium]|nr:hypothetical protein [Alphaproteobacteria bacterium]
MIEEQLKEAKDEEKTREENVKSICQTEVNQKKSIYENLKKSNASDETIANAADDYERSKMKCDEENMALAQAKKHKEFLEESKKSNEEEKQKVGTAADPVHQKYQERIDAISQLEEKTVEIGAKETNENWDDVDVIEAYTITESEYVDFINQYFINESNIQGGLVGTQTEIDRVMRERRRLFINTAVHLLQVSGSTRRDIKTKTTKIKELYDEVRTTEDEFKAIGYYSGSKIDNIRALVLYAKILSTKLQYMAAKDLLTIEPSRRGKAEDASYDKFDLTKYKLTDSYVKAIEEDSNKGIDIHEGVSAE